MEVFYAEIIVGRKHLLCSQIRSHVMGFKDIIARTNCESEHIIVVQALGITCVYRRRIPVFYIFIGNGIFIVVDMRAVTLVSVMPEYPVDKN